MQDEVCESSSLYSSGFCNVNLTSAAAIGRCSNNVLCGSLLIGRLLLQVFSVGLGCALRSSLFCLQLSLTLRDHIVCLQDKEGKTTIICKPFMQF